MTASVIKQQVVVFILGCQHVYIVKETGCVVLKSKTKTQPTKVIMTHLLNNRLRSKQAIKHVGSTKN